MESHEGSHNQSGNHHQHHPKSTSELMSSAKVVADAAKSTFNKESGKVDKGRAAAAAADLLEAASHYGKLEENKTYGQYVEKAENYLHKYSSHSTTTTVSSGHSSATAEGAPAKHSETHSGGGDGHSGYGDYMKMAQGFMKSSGSDNTESHSSGGDGEKSGYGDYLKMAQGFLKK